MALCRIGQKSTFPSIFKQQLHIVVYFIAIVVKEIHTHHKLMVEAPPLKNNRLKNVSAHIYMTADTFLSSQVYNLS